MIDRYLRWYEKNGNKFIGEIKIDKVSIDVLITIFNPPDNDIHMYDCYPVNNSQWEHLNTLVDIYFEYNEYDYFIESEQGDE